MTQVELSAEEYSHVEVCPDLVEQRWYSGLLVGFRLGPDNRWVGLVQWSRGPGNEPERDWFAQDQVRGLAASPR
jgi:hypothetical protein